MKPPGVVLDRIPHWRCRNWGAADAPGGQGEEWYFDLGAIVNRNHIFSGLLMARVERPLKTWSALEPFGAFDLRAGKLLLHFSDSPQPGWLGMAFGSMTA
jgi:hypothetical protein